MAITYLYTRPIPGVTTGPSWATYLNDFASNVRGHNHTGSDEVKIVPAGININSSVDFASNPASAVSWAQFSPADYAAGTQYRIFSKADGNLYYETSTGTQIQITDSSGVYNPSANANSGFYGNYATVLARTTFTQASIGIPDTSPAYTLSGSGGVLQARVNARNFYATPPASGTTIRAFMTGTFGIDNTGIYAGLAGTLNASPVIGTLPLSFDSSNTSLRAVTVNPTLINITDVYAFSVGGRTADAAGTNSAVSQYVWRTSGGSYAAKSGYAVDYFAETSLGGSLFKLASFRPWFGAVGGTPKGSLTIYATSALNNVFLDMTTANNKILFGKTSDIVALAGSDRVYSDYGMYPTSNGLALGTTGLAWDISATVVQTSGAIVAGTSLTASGAFTANSSATFSAVPQAPSYQALNAAGASPSKGQVYSNNVPLAWGRISTTPAVLAGFNVSGVSGATSTGLTVSLDTGAAGTTSYSVVVTSATLDVVMSATPVTANTFLVRASTVTAGAVTPVNVSFSFAVMGT